MVQGIMTKDEQSYKSAVSISIVGYILSALPYNIISKSAVNGACTVLLQQGEYSVKSKSNKTLQTVAGVYWLVITAIYLAYNFITFNWAMSWIIWPVAGVIFAAIKLILEQRA